MVYERVKSGGSGARLNLYFRQRWFDSGTSLKVANINGTNKHSTTGLVAHVQ